jgi:hypothetical protein
MTDAAGGADSNEQKLIAEARTNFGGFFRWVDVLNEMIQKDIGPKYGIVVNNQSASVADGKVSAALDATRPGKPALNIPFEIQGDSITLAHAKFELTNAATGQKSATFTSRGCDDVNRILSDIMQDYIG